MDGHFAHLAKPLTIRGKTLKNRIVFGAHTANMAENGLPGERHLGYYTERARGGAGMIVVEPVPVHRTGVLTRGNFRHDDDAVIAPFRRITDACHEHGTVMVQQLYHVGQHGDSDLSFAPHWSPSGHASYHDSDGSRAMRAHEIEEIIEGHVQAARRCQEAGFDGVEIWAAYHSLLEQFWSPWSNTREDEWGGSLENRMRITTRIFEAVRRQCGEDFIIGLALSHGPSTPFIMDIEGYQEIVSIHDRAGHMDYVTCGSGSYLDFDQIIPAFTLGEKLGCTMSRAIKDVVKNGVVTAESHIRTPENADAVIGAGDADLVSIVRGQIADPHLASKALDGRSDDIRGCISCNQMCWGRRSRDYWISCLINPSAGREFEWGGDRFTPSKNPGRVLVVGAGPAGLECARVAAERGHQVILCEASGETGGQFRLAGLQPRRAQILDLLDWYERQFMRLGVDLRYHTPVEASEVAGFEADHVVLATGSLPAGTGKQRWLPQHEQLPGLENGHVWAPEDILRRTAQAGARVIVLDEGGNWRGCGTAWYLAERGHKVTIVTPDAYVGKEITRTSADFQVRKNLVKSGADFLTESVITNWHGNGATITSLLDGTQTFTAADDLVYATTNVACDELENELRAVGQPVHIIGDCAAPRLAAYAIFDGRATGNLL